MHAELGGRHVPCLDPAKGQDPCWECQEQGVHYSGHKSNLKESSKTLSVTGSYTLNGEYLSQFLNNDFLDFQINFH